MDMDNSQISGEHQAASGSKKPARSPAQPKKDTRIRLPADCCAKIFELTPKLNHKTNGQTIEWVLRRVEESGSIAAAVAARKQSLDPTVAAAPDAAPPPPPVVAPGFDIWEANPTVWMQPPLPPPPSPPLYGRFVAEQTLNPSYFGGFSDSDLLLLEDPYVAWLLSPTAAPQEVNDSADEETLNLDDCSVGGCGGGFSQLMGADHPIFQNPYPPPTGRQEEEEGGPSRG